MISFKNYQLKAINRIFLDSINNGFWDKKYNRIVSKLVHDDNFIWSIKKKSNKINSDRYGVFTISLILLSYLLFQKKIILLMSIS